MSISRRDFVRQGSSCAAHIALAGALLPPLARMRWTSPTMGRIVASEPFGKLEEIGPGIWALISFPLSGDRTTLSNGGLIAGRNGVLAIEGFMMPAGAKWLAEQSKALTGKWPTHVLLSHYHGDHTNGVAGYFEGGNAPVVRATVATRDSVNQRNQPADPARTERITAAEPLDPSSETKLDLGGRTVRLVPKAGHTSSDVAAIVSDPKVVFGGDLLWNGMFPNYMDCTPSTFASSIRSLRGPDDTIYVPGHGPVARNADIDRQLAMVEEVANAAKAAKQKGMSAAEGAAAYQLPASLGEWILFSPRFMEGAFTAWYRELDAKKG